MTAIKQHPPAFGNQPICGEKKTVFTCTRAFGHVGAHAAHTTESDTPVEVWGSDVPDGASRQMTSNSTVRVEVEMMDGSKSKWFFDDPSKARQFTDDLEKCADCYEFVYMPLAAGNRGKFPDARS